MREADFASMTQQMTEARDTLEQARAQGLVTTMLSVVVQTDLVSRFARISAQRVSSVIAQDSEEIARLSTDFEAEKADLERQIQAHDACSSYGWVYGVSRRAMLSDSTFRNYFGNPL
eukprot:3677575-Amphidinium_carterae.1